MSRKDIFSRYSQIYQKVRTKEVIPIGVFVRQLADIRRQGLDVGLFFKEKGIRDPRQVYLGNPIPSELAKTEGFLETSDTTFLSRCIIEKMKNLDYLKVVINARGILETKDERVVFLKRCQQIIEVVLRKAKNIIHLGLFTPFLFAGKIHTLDYFLSKQLKLDEVSAEAAALPFNVASPEYIVLKDGSMIVVGDSPFVPLGIFHFVGGLGYTFDKKIGAVSEERMFKSTRDMSPLGIDEAYVENNISRVTSDFQNNMHSLIFSDIWKKKKNQAVAVNMGGDMLIKLAEGSDIWQGIFEVYLKSPKET